MATFLQPLRIVLRNHLFKYNITSRSCTHKFIRTRQFLCPDHLKKELHSLCIKIRNDFRVKDLARPSCGYIHFSRSMEQNKLKASREMAEFDALFPELVEELTKNEIENPEIADAFLRFKEENVGLSAINDFNFLECCIYSLLRKYIKDKPYYLPILELFLQVGISDEESHMKAKTILLQLGRIFQVQNDYLDCFGSLEFTGKVGSDIEDNKCSWLILKALEIASDEQKEELTLNYGRRDKEAVEKVKAIYRDLKLEDAYKQYKESSYQEITNLISSADTAIPKEIFLDAANTIYKEIDQFTC